MTDTPTNSEKVITLWDERLNAFSQATCPAEYNRENFSDLYPDCPAQILTELFSPAATDENPDNLSPEALALKRQKEIDENPINQ